MLDLLLTAPTANALSISACIFYISLGQKEKTKQKNETNKNKYKGHAILHVVKYIYKYQLEHLIVTFYCFPYFVSLAIASCQLTKSVRQIDVGHCGITELFLRSQLFLHAPIV